MLNVTEIQREIRQFAQEREWERFHTPKNIAMALTVESAELMELFQWLTPEESSGELSPELRSSLSHEVADVAVYLLRLADLLNIDLAAAIQEKMRLNAEKYPVEKSKGHARKYDQL
jgi:dCTP diphosphatase